MERPPTIAGLPAASRWLTEPTSWSATADGALAITAGARTDLFSDPEGGGVSGTLPAPRLVAEVAGDFQFSAYVTVDFAATYDAGVLLVWVDERNWAKLCLEYAPQAAPMIVSVVTRGVSDDCNSFQPGGNKVWLRVARLGPAFAFHASTDGETWQMVRHFALGNAAAPVSVGFLAQSPTGQGCTATFSTVGYTTSRLADLRDGT